MTRKKKTTPSHSKRLQITDSSGWTHITHSLSKTHIHKQNHLPSTTPGTLQPAPIPSGQSLLHLQKQHAQYRSQWLALPFYRTIRKLFLEDIIASGRKGLVDNCVVLGLGSLSNGRRSSWWELVFLEAVLELLSRSSSSPPSPSQDAGSRNRLTEPHDLPQKEGEDTQGGTRLRVCLQDPVFNALDHTFLSSLGYIVRPHPGAFDQITESTFLFAPHVELEVYAKALDTSIPPRICVGTDLQECMDRMDVISSCSNPPGENTRKVFQRHMESTLSRPLPDFERDDWTYFTRVYWTKE